MSHKDPECSTFQKRPAYRYIRASDKIPTWEETRNTSDPIAWVRLFNPTGSGTWYIASYDPDTRECFGLVDLLEEEQGSFSMAELCAYRGFFGLPIERDLYWKPRPLSACYRS